MEYCTNVRASPDGYLFCMDKLFKTNKIEQVKFFCFVVIHDAISYRYILSFLFDMKRCIVLDALLSREKNSSFVEFFFNIILRESRIVHLIMVIHPAISFLFLIAFSRLVCFVYSPSVSSRYGSFSSKERADLKAFFSKWLTGYLPKVQESAGL